MGPSSHTKRASARGARRFPLGRPNGFAYLALLAAIVIIGVILGAAGRYWSTAVLRDKEEELLFRGGQYRQAIEQYYHAIPGRPQYPQTIDDLLADNRTAAGKHYLRRKYKDPITNGAFVEIRDQLSGRIIGVRSSSEKRPLKQAGFPEQDKDMEGKSKYSEWQFVAVIQPLRPGGLPGRPSLPAPRR
jgi:type II secretory pathway pseudopilin PulG